MTSDAILSPDGRYRYALRRTWAGGPHALFVMLNPSTADAEIDDPTIRRCTGFAREWGYGGLAVANLFALRATKPVELVKADDPVGPENDAWIERLVDRCPFVVAAWGAHKMAADRARIVLPMLGPGVQCLSVTSGGFPGHPLFLAKTSRPVPFVPSERAA